MGAAVPDAGLSPFAMCLTTTARRCREAGASVVCRQGYRMILRHSGGRHGDRDHPINLLGMLDGTVRGAKPQNVLGSLRVTEQDCSAVACLMLADIWEHSAHKLGRPERDYSDTVEHLRRIGRGEPPLLAGLLPRDVIEDAEQLALSLAGAIMRQRVAEACAWGASVDAAERVGLESWAETWAEYTAIMRRYLLPDPPEGPRLSCDGSVKDLAVLLERFQRRGVSLISVAESLDTGSAAGRLVLNIMVSVSQWEREAIGERTRDAMSHKRTNGERVGTIPFGYRLAADGVHLEAEPKEQEIIGRIRALSQEGHSTRRITETLNSEGYRNRRGSAWRFQYVASILQSGATA